MLRVWYDWRKKSRYRDVSKVCVPLVTGMAATTVMEFTDRIFLAHYSVNAISAVVPAGVTAFLLLCFFGGIAGYTSVFIAQYQGSGQSEKIGLILWQGIFFTFFSGVVLLLSAFFATGPFFSLIGHSLEIRILEIRYFKILCQGGVLHVLIQTLSGFFTGRGMTRPVMIANIVGMVVNIPLNYAMINGIWGAPELGITGAGIATVVSWGVTVLCLALSVFTSSFVRQFRLLEMIEFDREIFIRLLRFGAPGALQFSLDIFAFTFFILIVGRMGTVPLAASNIVLSISSIAFMPALGFSFGMSSMTGQALGKGEPGVARAAIWSGIHLLILYTILLDCFFVFAPETIIALFMTPGEMGGEYEKILQMGSTLLRMVSVYVLLDVFYMIFAAALKGAGDTRFLLCLLFWGSLVCMILPLSIGIRFLGMGIYAAWSCIIVFIGFLAVATALRYHGRKWEGMLVIASK